MAYRLRDRDVLLLEREPQPGGVAKSETWQGLEYSIGAAYIIDPDPSSTDPRDQAGFALLEEAGSFLENPVLADVTATLGARGALVGRQYGPYRIRRVVGGDAMVSRAAAPGRGIRRGRAFIGPIRPFASTSCLRVSHSF